MWITAVQQLEMIIMMIIPLASLFGNYKGSAARLKVLDVLKCLYSVDSFCYNRFQSLI